MFRLPSILIAALLALQLVLGGGRGVATMCFGPGHEHMHSEPACDHSTTWRANWPMPVVHAEHEHGCCCTDVVIDLADLTIIAREDADEAAIAPPPASASLLTLYSAPGHDRRGPPLFPPWLDLGREHQLAIVSCTRLTI